MPRPNQMRSISGEAHLARRIAFEREARGWTYEGLASRMSKVGCAIQSSAIYKIEKAHPPRRIVVDELIGFARVFGLTVEQLLQPRESALNDKLRQLYAQLEEADRERVRAQQDFLELRDAVEAFFTEHRGEIDAQARAYYAAYVEKGDMPKGHPDDPLGLKQEDLSDVDRMIAPYRPFPESEG